jgi:uncharacterized membrane protein YvlD (DUF360 family)
VKVEKSSLHNGAECDEIREGDIVKDPLDDIQTKLVDHEQEKMEQQKVLDEQQKAYKKELKEQKRKEKWNYFAALISAFFKVETYIGIIQRNVEPLFMVLFINVTIGALLFSILYITYITVIVDETFDIPSTIVKIAGAIVTAVLCIIIQNNLPSDEKSKSEE